jgi:DNA-binding transcriptional MerR regulator
MTLILTSTVAFRILLSVTSYSIAELAAAGGVSRRTVRFYVQRGLLLPPEGLGRGARYTGRHLARLLQIKGWQEQAVPLEEIRDRLQHEGEVRGPARRTPAERQRREDRTWQVQAIAAAPGAGWFRQPLAPGFELHVAAGTQPLTAQQLAALAGALTDIVKNGGEEE